MVSFYGGTLLTITGNGFSRNVSALQIMVGTRPCPVVQATPSQLQCTVPSQGNGSSVINILVNSNGITFPGSFSPRAQTGCGAGRQTGRVSRPGLGLLWSPSAQKSGAGPVLNEAPSSRKPFGQWSCRRTHSVWGTEWIPTMRVI